MLVLGIAVLTALRLVIGSLSRTPRMGQLLCLPSLALAGLALLGVAQAIPLPEGLVMRIAPMTGHLRATLAPFAQGLTDDSFPAILPPAATLAMEPEAAFHVAVQLAAIWVLFQCVLGLDLSYAKLRRFGLAIAINATLLALFSLIQALTWNGKIYGVRPSPIANRWYTGGPFVCHNHLAAYLNLGLGFVARGPAGRAADRAVPARHRGRSARSVDRGRFLWMAYGVAVIVVGLIATHSRGGFLAMIASVGVTFLVLRPKVVKLRAGLAAVLLIVPLFLVALGTDSAFQRLASILDAGDSGFNGRTEIWMAALRCWGDHPGCGVGLGNFEVAVGQAVNHDLGVVFQHAENEYLEMLVEGGTVGLTLFLLVFGSVARQGYRALLAAPTLRDRAWVLGAVFGGLALTIQALGDFPLHVPGIGVTGVTLAAFLYGLGRRAGQGDSQARDAMTARWYRGPAFSDLALFGLCAAVVVHDYWTARAEAAIAGTGLNLPGSAIAGSNADHLSRDELVRAEAQLKRALWFRPRWSEGHFQLGLISLQLYRHAAAELVGLGSEEADGPEQEQEEQPDEMTDPIWLLGVVHSAKPEDLDRVGGVLAHEPVRNHLLPAARSFLEMRRCSPFRAESHAHLACVDYLLQGGEPARVHIERALLLAGANSPVLAFAAVVSVEVGALDLAAKCWKKELSIHAASWPDIANMAGAALDPEQILDEVLPPGDHFEIWFADRLYADPEDQQIRDRFLRAALERVRGNTALAPAEKLWIQGQACARLDERDRARKLMQAALGLDARQGNWRQEFIGWLLDWGLAKEAHTQARIGVELNPFHMGLQEGATDHLGCAGPRESDDRR